MPGLAKEYDVIVIGGGINGLCAAAYLQKSGLKVACFERREEAGTHCTTEELTTPGVRHNLHASFLVTHHTGAGEDLELERFGFEPLTSGPWAWFVPFLDGSAVLFHTSDSRQTYELWKRINPRDAEQYRRMQNYLGPLWPDLMEILRGGEATPENSARLNEILTGVPGVPKDWPDMNGIELADLLFEDERIKATLLSVGQGYGVDVWLRTVGVVTPMFGMVANTVSWTARGGSHGLTHSLARCLMAHGGSLFQGCPVAKIDVQEGEAKGVYLSDDAIYPGAFVRASKAIVSDLTAVPTFLHLVGKEKLPQWVVSAVANYDYNGSILFTNYYSLKEPPAWRSAKRFPEMARAHGFNVGMETSEDFLRLATDLYRDRLPDPPIASGASCQGYVFADPTQAPPGQFTLMTWSNVPYDLRPLGGPQKWDDIREEYGDKVEEMLAQRIVNIKTAKLTRYIQTPLDIYRRNPSAIKGQWNGGAYTSVQMGAYRPFPGCNAPGTPIAKLYISNSISPQGTSNLAGGKTAANRVRADLGIPKPEWWRHKSFDAYPRMCAKYGLELHPTVD